MDGENKNKQTGQRKKEVKSFQELSGEVISDPNLKQRQPSPQPKDIDEIEY
jgi:hypothetical protein